MAKDLSLEEAPAWRAEPCRANQTTGLCEGAGRRLDREQQVEAEVAELTTALGEAAVVLRVWKKRAEGRSGSLRTPRRATPSVTAGPGTRTARSVHWTAV